MYLFLQFGFSSFGANKYNITHCLQSDREKRIRVLNQKYPPKVIWDSLKDAGYKKSGHLLVGMWINDVIAQN